MTWSFASLLPLANGIESVFWIVVVVASIIAQIAKAARKSGGAPLGGSGHAMGERPGHPASPEAELKQFLESLGGAQPRHTRTQQAPPPPPPAAPSPAFAQRAEPRAPRRTPPARTHAEAPDRATRLTRPPARKHVRTEHRHAPRKKMSISGRIRSAPPLPQSPPPATRTRVARAAVRPEPRLVQPSDAHAADDAREARRPRPRVHLQGKRINVNVLRSAVVWREILSPPVSLRREP